MTWSSAAAVVAAAAAVLAVFDAAAVDASADAAEAEEAEVVLVDADVDDSLRGDAETQESTGEGAAVVAFEDGRGDLEAEYGGADVGCHSRLEQGTEDVEVVALRGDGSVADVAVAAAAAAAAVDFVAAAAVGEKPTLAQPFRLSERIWPTVASAQMEQICQPFQANTSEPVCGRSRNV